MASPRGRSSARALVPLAALALAAGGCTPIPPEVASAPIPIAQTPGDGGVYAYAQFLFEGVNFPDTPTPILVDTGNVFTGRTIPNGTRRQVATETLYLYSAPADGAPVRRAEIPDVRVLEAQIPPIGVDDKRFQVGGILGGDVLQRYSVGFDFGTSPPSMSLGPAESACSCIAGKSGGAVIAFKMLGAGQYNFDDRSHVYPASRVTLPVCLEPVDDPIRRGVPCLIGDDFTLPPGGAAGGEPPDGGVLPACAEPPARAHRAPGYEELPPGAETRFLIATGFPGVLVSAGAYDRVHGRGAGRAILADDSKPWHDLYLTRSTDPIRVKAVTLGEDCSRSTDPGCRAALAIIRYEGLLGACGELARARRIRWSSSHPTDKYPAKCPSTFDPLPGMNAGTQNCVMRVTGYVCGSPDRCDDRDQPASPHIEIAGPIPAWLADDSAPILVEVNEDTRPVIADVEGVIGSEVLSRLQFRFDYPNNRLIARCATGAKGCRVYPRLACMGLVFDCGLRGNEADKVCQEFLPPSIPKACAVAN